jgi:hypothetical protein
MDVPDRPIYGNSFGVNTGVTNDNIQSLRVNIK